MSRALLWLWLIVAAPLAMAEGVATQEIEHLLGFVASSSCSFIRNGNHYNAQEAQQHIQKKYDYFRDEIKSAEDFIKYAATKSVLSGRRYSVECPRQPTEETAQWLLDELSRYRHGNE